MDLVTVHLIFGVIVIVNVNAVMETIVQRDIRNAFSPLTNRTDVMMKMYGEEMFCRTDDPVLVFQIPENDEENDELPDRGKMILMRRSMFLTPQFPNVTHGKVGIQVQQLQTNVYEANGEWSDFGLDGWSGAIATDPGHSLDAASENTTSESSNYPAKEIVKDFNSGGQLNGFVEDFLSINDNYQLNRNGGRTEIKQTEEISDNVYIARVNDPFGYSTKWQQKPNAAPNANVSIGGRITPLTNRSKRDVLELYSMIKCSTGCNPLAYKNYGCYCGFSGAGVPVDGIDRCCRIHDKCYENTNCISYLEYFVPYVWKCYMGKPLCAIDHGEWGGPASCAALLCYCDARLSRCLRKYSCPQRHHQRGPPVCRTSLARTLQYFLLNG